MANPQYQSLAQPYAALALDAETKEDVDLLRQATHDFTHWTPELIQMDKDLAMLLEKSGIKLTEAKAKTKRGRKAKAETTAAPKPKGRRGRPRKEKLPASAAQKHLNKFLRSQGKSLTADNLMSMLKSLQKDIQEGLIRKTDPNASDINKLQSRLVQLYERVGRNGTCTVASADMQGFSGLGCAGTSCGCSRSLNGPSQRTAAQRQLAKYRNLQGKVKTAVELERVIKSLQKDIEEERITKSDPLASRIRAMQDSLVAAHKLALAEGCVRLEAKGAVLNGLEAAIASNYK